LDATLTQIRSILFTWWSFHWFSELWVFCLS